jgi:transposase, IS5 family
LDPKNRWVILSKAIPWDKIVSKYNAIFKSTEGRKPISGRIVIGAVIIKHMKDLSDRETVLQISENVYMQYFLGYSSFHPMPPFDDTMFVDIRKRLTQDIMGAISEIIAEHFLEKEGIHPTLNETEEKNKSDSPKQEDENIENKIKVEELKDSKEASDQVVADVPNNQNSIIKYDGDLLIDATVAPQNITFPTDVKILNASREKTEEIIDFLYGLKLVDVVKPRTYREVARKDFLNIQKKKKKSSKEIYKGIGQQLRYLRRNIESIHKMLDSISEAGHGFALNEKKMKYFWVIQQVYDQQLQMHTTNTRTVEHRIVSIHQPHVRPMVRGKEGKNVEFGAKINVSMLHGYAFIDHFSWDAFNEGIKLLECIQQYFRRFKCYPKRVLVDQIYCNRENRKALKEMGIKLVAKALGRPSKKAVEDHVSPGERNPIEGKFGQAKTAYGLDKIRAKLSITSQSWIASIALVLNLVNMTRRALVCLIQKIFLDKNIFIIFEKPNPVLVFQNTQNWKLKELISKPHLANFKPISIFHY